VDRKKSKGVGAIFALTAMIIMISSACMDPGGARGSWGHAGAFRPETFTLDNGLQVITCPMPGSPQVMYMVWYKVGAADDLAGKAGLAHLVEHATFRGIGAHPEQDAVQIEMLHSASEVDAYTSYDYTVYYHVVPVQRLGTAMHTEADRMAKLVVTEAIL
jgi:zinc protease